MSEDTPPEPASRVGKFIHRYSGFLSSFVIGMAGLVATSIWQYRQSQIAARQAESEQAIARTKADNDWRIARAEILAKNLSVLSSQGADTADQRFGVLLSLTRGNILDPELAVSYALELGRTNPTYMRSVLASTDSKNYTQLEQAYVLTCLQRFGVEKRAEICKDDQLSERSEAIAQLVADELEAGLASGNLGPGPLQLLRDERTVQSRPTKFAWLFETFLQDAYERRQWKQIESFEASSPGARLVAALVLATARTGELVSAEEQSTLEKFHADRRHWLVNYMFSTSCDLDCRGKLMHAMLSSFGEAQGDYDDAFKRLITAPHSETGSALAQLHARLLWCQMDRDDLTELRDRVLVPTVTSVARDDKASPALVETLAALAGLVPEPVATAEADDARAWHDMTMAIDKRGDRFHKAFASSRTSAARDRANPPVMLRRQNFCTAEAAVETASE